MGQRTWPPPGELIERLASYGRTHGAWDDDRGYVEGSLARIIEAATAWRSPILPSVKIEPGFLCGLEFDSLLAEVAFFARHGLHIDDVEISIDLQPGELLVFDNLAVAHGRRGTRKPGELRQRMFGQRLQPAAQRKLRDSVLAAFYAGQPRSVIHGVDAVSSDEMTANVVNARVQHRAGHEEKSANARPASGWDNHPARSLQEPAWISRSNV